MVCKEYMFKSGNENKSEIIKTDRTVDVLYKDCNDLQREGACFCQKSTFYNRNIKNIVKIQSLWRKKSVKSVKDGFTKSILEEMIDKYNDLYLFYYKTNDKLNKKKMRLPNYPSEITENLVKFAIIKKYNVSPCWDTKKGDLYLHGKYLEVKGSCDLMNGGPSSFGPKEEWHRIYFVEAVDHMIKKFIVYEIKLSSKSEIWKNINVSETQTYYEQCCQNRRPRITFVKLIKQIPEKFINIIFNGYINDL